MTPEAARGRWAILVLILTAQTVSNVGPLGLPAIASLIRDDLGLTLSQAGSFVSAYYVGPVLMSRYRRGLCPTAGESGPRSSWARS